VPVWFLLYWGVLLCCSSNLDVQFLQVVILVTGKSRKCCLSLSCACTGVQCAHVQAHACAHTRACAHTHTHTHTHTCSFTDSLLLWII
jgi:hypothetical protein